MRINRALAHCFSVFGVAGCMFGGLIGETIGNDIAVGIFIVLGLTGGILLGYKAWKGGF